MAVDTKISDNIMWITLNRPEAGNALNGEVGEGLSAAFAEVATNDDIRVVVVTGAGEKIFCAGMDLKAFAAGMDMAPVARGLDALRTCEKPVIAAVNGAALAGGFEVMMSCDLVVAVSHSKFGIPEVKRGLFAAGGGTRLPTRIPLTVALEMGMTGDPITPERALHLGLVNQVVPADELHSATAALAARITANGPLAVRATKKLMHMEIPEANTKALGEATAQVFASEDAREGATAFAQKRAPEWKGR
ncbi:MAG: hypothetical protein RL419_1075 [Actinomycetota bacterium]